MDDDKTTMARIRSELDLSISKWSDVNHTSEHLTNSLFTLQKKHKVLSNNVIAFLKKCFNYALAQTKGERGSCKLQIEQIVPHAFGEHSMCGDWCQIKDDPESYTHNTLIKDLSGDELRKNLETVSHLFSQNSENIAPGGSTREVESFNNMVASKAPKRHHFSASSNLLSRVGCAVVQKNISYSYTAKMNEMDGSPVPAVPLKDALSNFVKWLQSIGQAVLVGHSFKVYVFPRLIRALRAVNLESEFLRSCVGSIDTLPIFKTIFPELETYKQTDLVEALLKETYTAHNAVEDVKSLKELFYFSNVPQELMIKFSFTTKWGFDNLTFLNQTTKNVKTMDALSTNKVVSKQMINTCRMTSSGLKYCDLVNV